MEAALLASGGIAAMVATLLATGGDSAGEATSLASGENMAVKARSKSSGGSSTGEATSSSSGGRFCHGMKAETDASTVFYSNGRQTNAKCESKYGISTQAEIRQQRW